MKCFPLFFAICCIVASGCAKQCQPCPPPAPVCHRYHAPDIDWLSIRRLLLVPLENESSYPHATFEVQESLAARLQCSGRFEVVLASPESYTACHDSVRINGRFDEVELLYLAERYNADAIVFGTITQYQPYSPPRLGLSLRMISPANAVLIASVDGLWDGRDQAVAEQARYYTGNVLNDNESLMACNLTLDSPVLFRRFACHFAVEALVSPVLAPVMNTGPPQPAPGGNPNAAVQATPPAASTVVSYPPPVPGVSPAPPNPAPPNPAPPNSVPTLPALPIEVPEDAGSPNEMVP